MGKGRGNVPAFASFMNSDRLTKKANKGSNNSSKVNADSASKGQSMKNSNVSHRTCQ